MHTSSRFPAVRIFFYLSPHKGCEISFGRFLWFDMLRRGSEYVVSRTFLRFPKLARLSLVRVYPDYLDISIRFIDM